MVHHFIPLGIGNRAHGGEEWKLQRVRNWFFFLSYFLKMSIAVHKSIWKNRNEIIKRPQKQKRKGRTIFSVLSFGDSPLLMDADPVRSTWAPHEKSKKKKYKYKTLEIHHTTTAAYTTAPIRFLAFTNLGPESLPSPSKSPAVRRRRMGLYASIHPSVPTDPSLFSSPRFLWVYDAHSIHTIYISIYYSISSQKR